MAEEAFSCPRDLDCVKMQIAGIGAELESWRQTSQHNNTYLKRAGFSDVQVRTDDDWVRASSVKREENPLDRLTEYEVRARVRRF